MNYAEHELKILPEYFKAVKSGLKNFELRYNDRGFEVGDTVILREYIDGKYTGHRFFLSISYILDGGQYGLPDGYCIFSWIPEAND